MSEQPQLSGVSLARHGETDDNVEPFRFQGFTDTPLNATGLAQARDLAERLSGAGLRMLWASDLSRARETAEIVGARIGLTPRLDARLREGNRGRWEEHTFAEIERTEPDLYAAWQRAETGFRFPGGEALVEHQARVLEVLGDLHAQAALPALAVCHGGSIRAALCAYDPRGLAAFHTFDVPNTAWIEL